MRYDYQPTTFWVYLMASQRKGALYTGMTSDIQRRAYEHLNGMGKGFSAQKHTDILVYFEEHPSFESAKTREKRIKHWKRMYKIEMIEARNPTWMDLRRKVGVERAMTEHRTGYTDLPSLAVG